MDWLALFNFLSRYVLAALAAMVLLRTLFLAARQWVDSRREGFGRNTPVVGVLVDETGREYPLEYDNILGSSRRCDIRLPDESVARVHAQIYQRRARLYLQPFARAQTLVNGEPILRRFALEDGDELCLGDAVLALYLTQTDGEG